MKTNFKYVLEFDALFELILYTIALGAIVGFAANLPSVSLFFAAYFLVIPGRSEAERQYFEIAKKFKDSDEGLGELSIFKHQQSEALKSWERVIALEHSKAIIAGLLVAFCTHWILDGMKSELVYAEKYRNLIVLTSNDPREGHRELASLALKTLPPRRSLVWWATGSGSTGEE